MLSAFKSNYNMRLSDLTYLDNQLNLCSQWPKPHEPDVPEDVPDNVRVVYTEAEQAYMAHIYSAAAERYRKSLQLAMKEKGATKGYLINQIDKLHDEGILPSGMKDIAHAIRIIGNKAAHDEPLSEEDAKKEAKDIREFAALFMTYLFTLPARIKIWQQEALPAQDALVPGATTHSGDTAK